VQGRKYPEHFGMVQKAKTDQNAWKVTEIRRDHLHLSVQKVQEELNMNKYVFKMIVECSAGSKV
jgi:hypothetical protein